MYTLSVKIWAVKTWAIWSSTPTLLTDHTFHRPNIVRPNNNRPNFNQQFIPAKILTKLNAGVDNMMSDVYQTFIRPYIGSWYSLRSEILDVRKSLAFYFAKMEIFVKIFV